MNIWIVNHYAIPPSMGGLVRHFYFSRYLQQKGHKVKIFTSSKIHNTDINMIQDKSLYKEEMENGVEYTFVRSRNYKGNGLDRIWNMIELPFKMWKTMKVFYKSEKPDVIYTSSPDLFVAFSALCFGKGHRIPIVVEVRDLWPESIVEYGDMSKKNPIIQILYQLEKWMYRKAEQLIFTMPGGKDYICDKKWEGKIDLNKVNYINNGVDIEEFESNIHNYVIKDKDLEDVESFKVVYVGSIRYANNIGMLVNVAKELKSLKEKDIKILIYGEGTNRKVLERQCILEGIDNIVFKGKVEKKYIPYILSKSDLNILNYQQANTWRYGGSQNKQFEYLASGKPICSNVQMGYSIIKKYGCGEEKNITTSGEYVETILKYKNMEKQVYEQQCENAKEAAKQYDYSVLGGKIERVLKKVADR